MKYKKKIKSIIVTLWIVSNALLAEIIVAEGSDGVKPEKKAILVSKLVAYTLWPQKELSIKRKTHFHFCTFKNKVLAAQFQSVYDENKVKVKLKKLKVVNKNTISEIRDCHLVYLSSPSMKDLQAILALSNKQSILLIGENAGQAEKGVHYNLYIENQRIGFEINRKALKLSRLKPNYRLLNYGKIIKGSKS